MGHWVDCDSAANCAFQSVAYCVLFGQVLIVLGNHFGLAFSRLSGLQDFTYHISPSIVYPAITLLGVSLFLVVVFTFEFRDEGNAGADNSGDRR